MPDSLFVASLNIANDAFANLAGEKIEVVKTGNTGEYDAVNIDDLTTGTSLTPGGFHPDNSVVVWVNRDVFLAMNVDDGSILKVRGNRVRISAIADEGDNTIQLQCASTALKL